MDLKQIKFQYLLKTDDLIGIIQIDLNTDHEPKTWTNGFSYGADFINDEKSVSKAVMISDGDNPSCTTGEPLIFVYQRFSI